MTADVVVIGGGIVGCAIAYRFSRAKLEVVLLERGDLGAEASRAALGVLAPRGGTSTQDSFFRLCQAGLQAHRDWEAELGEDGVRVPYKKEGLLELAFSDEKQSQLDEGLRREKALGIRVERLERRELLQMEPAISPGVRQALFYPDHMWVENGQLTEGLGQAARRRGAEVRTHCGAVTLRWEGSRLVGVRTGDQELGAAYVVNAAGCWAASVDGMPARFAPVIPVRGQYIELDDGLQPTFRHIVHGKKTYLVSRPGGKISAGATVEHAGYEKKNTAEGLQGILKAALTMAPALKERAFLGAWSGLRPCSRDGLPILGPAEPANLLLATGHFRGGILLAPVTADLLLEYVQSGHQPELLGPFSPLRFASEG
ncbi:MAG: glycine oxidase ThiO [Acidobacteria bacterium]|nr:glycine oxidase ThiO [Acidobacteriota bacterium]